MRKDNRNFIIFYKHRRWKRTWQFFFTGWGLVMLAALVAGSLFTKQLLWTPITAINMKEIASNQFKMSNASFSGIDKNGEPFVIRAAAARQEYDQPDIIYIDKVSGNIVRITGGKKIRDKIRADAGHFNQKAKVVTLFGNVRVDSDNGDKLITEELVIKL